MGLIVDDHDKNLHLEVRRESFVLYTDGGDERIELAYNQLSELEYLVGQIRQAANDAYHVVLVTSGPDGDLS